MIMIMFTKYLNMQERAIIMIILENVNSTKEIIVNSWISSRSFDRYIKWLIEKWYVYSNNIWFESNSYVWVSYHKKYNLTSKYLKKLKENNRKLFTNYIELSANSEDEIMVNQHIWKVHYEPLNWYWTINWKKLWTAEEYEKFKNEQRWVIKWEQVRVNWVKDTDLKQMIHEAGKQAKILQMERDVTNDDVSIEDIEKLINL